LFDVLVTTSRSLTHAAPATAHRLDDRVGSYLARPDEHALSAADRAHAELAARTDRGPPHGIPIGVKNVLEMAEGPTTAQSLVLHRTRRENKTPPSSPG
jgi:aspartyl-tRNA(Asn)/glutamyl-tRNA(Gln) amidotransferase subunit A